MMKAIITMYYSKADKAGNVYWAFAWTDTDTGRQAVGRICGGESNILATVRQMGSELGDCYYLAFPYGIRAFNKLTKNWPYAGCTPDELATCIRSQLNA